MSLFYCYIEGNPVRAGLVNTATGWVWSSHRERCGFEAGNVIAPLPAPFAGNWTEFVDTPLTGVELAKVKRKIDRQSRGLAPQVLVPLGGEEG